MATSRPIIIDRSVRAAHAAQAQNVTLDTTALPVVSGNSRRQSIYMANPSAAVPIWVSIDPLVAPGAGIRIDPGDVWVVSSPQDTIMPQYPWWGVANAVGAIIHIITVELVGLTPFAGGYADAEQWADVQAVGASYSRSRASAHM